MARHITNFISLDISDEPSDTFRKDTGNYWVDGRHGVQIPASEKKIDMSFGKEEIYKTAKAPFFNTQQQIEITGNPTFFQSEADWKTYITEMFPIGSTFKDFAFELESLASKYQVGIGDKNSLYGDVDFIYNFYVRTYEFLLKMPQISENILPNIYAEISDDADNLDPFFSNLITGFGVAPKQEVKMMNLKKNASGERKQAVYKNIANKMAKTGGNNRSLLSERYSNIIFPMENIDILKDIESSVNIFPMVSKIEFRTDSRTEFAQILKDSKLSSSLLKYISLMARPFTTIDQQNSQASFLQGVPYKSLPVPLGSQLHVDAATPGSGGSGTIFGDLTTQNTTPSPSAVVSPTHEFDLLEWWDRFLNNTIDMTNSHKTEIFMGDQCQAVKTARDIQSSFSKILSLLIFSGKLQTLIKKKMRGYASISNGEQCYSETVAYRVAKFASSVSGTPIQSIWFPNSNEIDVIKYFDTQVKYNKQYVYVIYAYNLVIGAEYDYSNAQIISSIESINPPVAIETPQTTAGDVQFAEGVEVNANTEIMIMESAQPNVANPSSYYTANIENSSVTSAPDLGVQGNSPSGVAIPAMAVQNLPNMNPLLIPNYAVSDPTMSPQRDYSELRASVTANIRPSLKIIESVIYTRPGRIMDSPPVAPDSFIFPLKGIDNKIKINLNTHIGSYLLDPIILNQPMERESINKLRQAKSVPGTTRLWYTTDDPVDHFEIYRTTQRPEKYTDFANQLYTLVNTDVDPKTFQKASAASYLDNIKPNVEYYYMFRSIDRHGNFSNPSPVFSVIMVSNDGIIFPLIKPILLKPAMKPRRPKKTFKKMLNIIPTAAQSIIDYARTNIETASSAKNATVVLGIEDEGLFGNKFKIRLISKNTGKKMDLNIRFKTKAKITERERK